MNDEWETPPWLFQRLNSFYHFEIDIAANEYNAKCAKYTRNAFRDKAEIAKYNSIWCNPPYSKGNIERFVDLFVSIGRVCGRVVTLPPVDTSTAWWRKGRQNSLLTVFFYKRIQFVGGADGARFPNALMIFGTKPVTANEYTFLEVMGDIWLNKRTELVELVGEELSCATSIK